MNDTDTTEQHKQKAARVMVFGGRRQSKREGASGAKEEGSGGCTAAKLQGLKLLSNWLLRYQDAEQ